MQLLDSDLAAMEPTPTQDIPTSHVVIIQDRSSTLYLADDASLDHPIFLEVSELKASGSPQLVTAFEKRIRAITQVPHANVAPILDSGLTDNGHLYAAIDHFTAVPLTQRLIELRRGGQRSAVEMLELTGQIADALNATHRVGVIHQDLRPEKILLNEHNRPQLIGFTVVQSPNQTRHTISDLAPVDELDYESPEQAAGEPVTKVSNVYSLGVMLYELLAGKRPSVPIGQWQVADLPQSRHEMPLEDIRSDLAKDTYTLVRRCLQDVPSERYQTMGEVQAAIQKALMAEQTTADRAAVTQMRHSPSAKRFPAWLVALLVLLLLIGAGAAAAFYLRGDVGTMAETMEEEAAVSAGMGETAVPTATLDWQATAIADATAKAEQIAALAAAEEAAAEPTPAQASATPAPAETAAVEPAAAPTVVVIEAEICQPAAAIVLVYPHTARGYNLTLTGIDFPLNWEIQNIGNCPVPATTQLVYVSGETFGAETSTVVLGNELAVNDTTTISSTLASPKTAGSYLSTWQLVDEEKSPVSAPFTFELRTFVSQTEVEEAAALPTQPLDWSFTVDGTTCEMADSDWTCEVVITPTGGSGQYALQLFDQPGGEATFNSGAGPFIYQATAKRCEPFKRDLKISDSSTGVVINASLSFAANDFFSCTE